MRPDPDLMERVAAADPLPGAERLTPDEEREAEALLARLLATQPESPATRRAPHPRLRRWTLAAIGAACLAAVAITALDLGDTESPGTGVDAQAVAARTVAAVTQEDSVYHVLQLKRATGSIEALRLGPRTGPFYVESWHSSAGRIHEKVFGVAGEGPGALLAEWAGTLRPDAGVGPLLTYDPVQNSLRASAIGETPDPDVVPVIEPTGDPAATLRRLEAQGALRAVAATRVGDRRAYRLVSDPIEAEGGEQRFEYIVDSETYLPLRQLWALRRGDEEYGIVSEFVVYERLPQGAHSTAQLDLDRHPGATCAAGAGAAHDERELGFANPCPASGGAGPARWP